MVDGLRPIPQIPPVLQDASRRGVLIPFVGAGVSVLAGCPTWHQLADGALRDCIRQGKFTYGQLAQIEHLSPRVRLSIARGLELEHGIKIDFRKLVQPDVSAEKKEIGNRVYRFLGKLGSTFVTTNYDGWLDTEIADQLASFETPAAPQTTTTNAASARRRIHEVNEFTPANLNQTKTVIHLHGSLAAPDGMIMTTREYITRYRNDRTDADPARENRTLTFLDYLFTNKTVLFVGYGLDDLEILEYVIQKARIAPTDGQAEAKHFYVARILLAPGRIDEEPVPVLPAMRHSVVAILAGPTRLVAAYRGSRRVCARNASHRADELGNSGSDGGAPCRLSYRRSSNLSFRRCCKATNLRGMDLTCCRNSQNPRFSSMR